MGGHDENGRRTRERGELCDLGKESRTRRAASGKRMEGRGWKEEDDEEEEDEDEVARVVWPFRLHRDKPFLKESEKHKESETERECVCVWKRNKRHVCYLKDDSKE